MLDLLVQNVCKIRKIGDKQLENEEFVCFKPSYYDKIIDKINNFVEQNSESEIKNVLKTLKDNLKNFDIPVVYKQKNTYLLIDFFDSTSIGLPYIKLTNLDKYNPKKHKITDLEIKYKPKFISADIKTFMPCGFNQYSTPIANYGYGIDLGDYYEHVIYHTLNMPTREELHSAVPKIVDLIKKYAPEMFRF